jgi:hypothetical protein
MGKVFLFFIMVNFFLLISCGREEFMSTSDLARQYYKAIIGIELLSDRCSKNHKSRDRDHMCAVYFEDGPNPIYNQTEQGLLCVFFFKSNPILLTPWGEWALERRDIVREFCKKKFLSLLEAKMSDRYSFNSAIVGNIGPVYEISKIDDFILPVPILSQSDSKLSYDEVIAVWEALKQQ